MYKIAVKNTLIYNMFRRKPSSGRSVHVHQTILKIDVMALQSYITIKITYLAPHRYDLPLFERVLFNDFFLSSHSSS